MAAHLFDVMPAFLVACLILAALPGPATALFLHRSVRDGRAAGLAAVVGNEIGIFGWTLAGGAGLSVLLMANRALSLALHVIGAAILIWLGVSAWRTANHPATITPSNEPRGRTPVAAFRAALLSIAANPKAAPSGLW
ncbi:LysE family translocator [Mycobacterium sp. B14F4]|uniref:LysE family translocator n=1 Tax=Mycobacterium sp. B14F4 TaxID=3153565 RepID=UPI00325F66CD